MNQSNKTLISVVSIAVIIFLSALIWKQTNSSNEEVVNYDSEQKIEVKKPKKRDGKRHTPKQKIVKNEPVEKDIIKDIKEPLNLSDFTEEKTLEIKEAKDRAGNKMFMAMRYKTPESLVDAIKQAQGSNNTEHADSLIAFLLEQFPDYELPADF